MSDPAELLAAARRRLETLALYPDPVRDDVRVVAWPWLFRLPRMRRYWAYALVRTIVLKEPVTALVAKHGPERIESLLVHELCHVWQHQHHPVRTTLALFRYRYRDNPFEQEARQAAAAPVQPGRVGR